MEMECAIPPPWKNRPEHWLTKGWQGASQAGGLPPKYGKAIKVTDVDNQ